MTDQLEISKIRTSVSSSEVKELVSNLSENTVKAKSLDNFSQMIHCKFLDYNYKNFSEVYINYFNDLNHSSKKLQADIDKLASDKGNLINYFYKYRFLKSENVHYKKTQRWQGYITRIEDSYIEARLKDLNNGGTDELAEFYIDEISPSDRSLISLGAVFYWSLGYKYTNGQITKESLIRFQRLPAIKSIEFDHIVDSSKELSKSIDWS